VATAVHSRWENVVTSMPISKKQAERWAQVHQKGRANFIWFRGVVCWGITTAILWSAFMAYFVGNGSFVRYLVPAFVVFPIGGYFWGVRMWRWGEGHFDQEVE